MDGRHCYFWSAQYDTGEWILQADNHIVGERSVATLDPLRTRRILLTPNMDECPFAPTIELRIDPKKGERFTKCWTVFAHNITGESVFETLGLETMDGEPLPVQVYVQGSTIIIASSWTALEEDVANKPL